MSLLLDPEFWARLASIVVIDLSLAGDNALVIALAVRSLPAREQWLGRVWGTAAAVALRLLFIAVVSALLTIPLLRAVGGLLLLWIAIRLVRPGGSAEGHVRHGTSLRQAVWIIMVADVTMSLDNVLAVAAAAHGDLLLVSLGIALSLPIVVWGSGFLARLMTSHAWIIWLGGGILGYVAGEMITDDPLVRSWLGAHADTVDDFVSVLLALGLALLGWWLARAAASRPPARGEA
jgi:YjbE family integral membrane protein